MPSASTGSCAKPGDRQSCRFMSALARIRSTSSRIDIVAHAIAPAVEVDAQDNDSLPASNAPEPAPPIGLDRHRQLRQVAPSAMHEIVHAFHAALFFRPIGMIEKSADHQLALQIAGLELAQLQRGCRANSFSVSGNGSTSVSSPLASMAAMVLSCPSRSPLICSRLSRYFRRSARPDQHSEVSAARDIFA